MGCKETANETACMISKSTRALLNVSDAYYGNATGKNLPHKEAINNTQWGPVVDGVLLTQPPIQMLREGKVLGGPKVPVLLGSNSNEGSTFLTDQVNSKSDFIGWCNIKFGNTTGALVSARYIKLQPPVRFMLVKMRTFTLEMTEFVLTMMEFTGRSSVPRRRP